MAKKLGCKVQTFRVLSLCQEIRRGHYPGLSSVSLLLEYGMRRIFVLIYLLACVHPHGQSCRPVQGLYAGACRALAMHIKLQQDSCYFKSLGETAACQESERAGQHAPAFICTLLCGSALLQISPPQCGLLSSTIIIALLFSTPPGEEGGLKATRIVVERGLGRRKGN